MRKYVALIAAVGAFSLVGCDNSISVPKFEKTSLSTVAVKDIDPASGYSRTSFKHWVDEDNDGCDTRAEILERDAVPGTALRTKAGCVNGADIQDPYSGTLITEEPGAGSAVDIDHVVALSDAWKKGAANLSATERQSLANDPDNLLAVDKSLNRRKGDKDASQWLPPNPSFRCEYVNKQLAVKEKYKLWVTQAEHDAIARVLEDC